jgi:23S rRNA (cytosine1962-C5)-methyltransferase
MDKHTFFLPDIADGEDKTSPLKNRIRKNFRHIKKWAKRTQTNCFRVYDRDIKEYPLCIDYYDGNFSVQFFTSTRESDEPPPALKELAQEAICSIFNAKEDAIYWRARIKRRRTEQYEKRDEALDFFTVIEYGLKFLVNLQDYLDTGLFLDHRETRRMVASLAKGKRLLNLFAYTCSFSVHAAAAGALYTKSVDMSNTYITWGKENFSINRLPLKNHAFVREDCLKFLDEERRGGGNYDIIVIDPPTISRSKKMEGMFDIQQDYPSLIQKAHKLLHPEGVMFFSTNSRRFDFEPSLFPHLKTEEITPKTIPFDFHNKKIHRCWKLIDWKM